jgi:Flp pilus assembly secretin CpaC
MSNRLLLKTVPLLVALLLTACTGDSVPTAKYGVEHYPGKPTIVDPNDTVRGRDEPPVVTLKLGDRLTAKPLIASEQLPGSIMVGTTNLNGVPLPVALQAVLGGTNIALSWQDGSFEDKTVTIFNLGGPLQKVVEQICSAAKVFCAYRNGTLELSEEETFVVSLPTVSGDADNTIAQTVGQLIGKSDGASLDKAGGTLVYTADMSSQSRVQQYLEQLRNGRPLVVLQMYIWEVTLDSDKATGINWSSMKFPAFGGASQNAVLSSVNAASTVTSGGISLGAVMSGKVDATVIAAFLSTQGVVQTVSNPQLTFVSGSSAEFSVGGKRRFVSQVGQLVASNVSGSTTNGSSGIGSNTVQTDEIKTGLTVTAKGAFENGVVFADLTLEITDLLTVREIKTGDTTLQLPETSDRKVSTFLRVRPGDNLVLAGMTSSRDVGDRQGVPLFDFLGSVPTYAHNNARNTELVVLLKPSVVTFSDKPDMVEVALSDFPVPELATAADAPVASPALPVEATGSVTVTSSAKDENTAKADATKAEAAPVAKKAKPSAKPVVKPPVKTPAKIVEPKPEGKVEGKADAVSGAGETTGTNTQPQSLVVPPSDAASAPVPSPSSVSSPSSVPSQVAQ